MSLRFGVSAGALLLVLLSAPAALPQAGAPALTDQQIREILVFNSPWESRSTTPGQLYRYRASFTLRGGEVVAQVMRYATNEQGDSIVTIRDGRVAWMDTDGANVSVAVQGDELVGTAISKTSNLNVAFKPRP